MNRTSSWFAAAAFLAAAATAIATVAMTGAQTAGAAAPDGPALLQGQVTTDGDAVDATVRTSLFPVMPGRGAKPGSTVRTLDLAPVATGADGRYVVPAPTADELRGYVDQWGRVSMTIVVDDGTHITSRTESTGVPADAASGAGARSKFAAPAPTDVPTFNVDLGTGTVQESLGQAELVAGRATVESVSAVEGRTAESAKHPCNRSYGDKHQGRSERFMYVNNWPGAKATVTQGAGTSHTLGIAWKLTGQNWSANDSNTKTISTSDQATRHNVVDRWVLNKVNYQDIHYKGLCEYPGERVEQRPYSVHTLIDRLEIRPFLPQLSDPAGCKKRGKDYEYTKNSTSNMTVSSGVDLLGINVQATSGWDSDTSWTIDVDKPTKECWSNPDGPMNSRYVHYSALRRHEPCGRDGRGANATGDSTGDTSTRCRAVGPSRGIVGR